MLIRVWTKRRMRICRQNRQRGAWDSGGHPRRATWRTGACRSIGENIGIRKTHGNEENDGLACKHNFLEKSHFFERGLGFNRRRAPLRSLCLIHVCLLFNFNLRNGNRSADNVKVLPREQATPNPNAYDKYSALAAS
jgi:hypothetical protein